MKTFILQLTGDSRLFSELNASISIGTWPDAFIRTFTANTLISVSKSQRYGSLRRSPFCCPVWTDQTTMGAIKSTKALVLYASGVDRIRFHGTRWWKTNPIVRSELPHGLKSYELWRQTWIGRVYVSEIAKRRHAGRNSALPIKDAFPLALCYCIDRSSLWFISKMR